MKGLILYAKRHNLSLKGIDLELDTLASLNLASPIFVPISKFQFYFCWLYCCMVLYVSNLPFLHKKSNNTDEKLTIRQLYSNIAKVK